MNIVGVPFHLVYVFLMKSYLDSYSLLFVTDALHWTYACIAVDSTSTGALQTFDLQVNPQYPWT